MDFLVHGGSVDIYVRVRVSLSSIKFEKNEKYEFSYIKLEFYKYDETDD